MNKAVALLAGTLMLSACVTGPSPVIPPAVTQAIQEVQREAKSACSVIPDAFSVAKLFGVNGLETPQAIADAICSAVAAAPARAARGASVHAPVTVSGITVSFVSKL